MDQVELNRAIAYQGIIGREREDFCVRFIDRKQETIKQIQQEIFRQAEEKGETITCHRGCSICCVMYIEANIQECEAIVYYLYQHPDTMNLFLLQYEQWIQRMRQAGDPFTMCERLLYENRAAKLSRDKREDLLDAIMLYQEMNVPCPFLHDHSCLIYAVRPYVCVNHYVTTPGTWCGIESLNYPMNPNLPRIYHIPLDDIINDRSFYRKDLAKPVIMFLHATVYRILQEGFAYLSAVTGLKELAGAPDDPEIKTILAAYQIPEIN